MAQELSDRWAGIVDRPRFEQYALKYQDFFTMQRRDGIIEVRMHTKGSSWVHGWPGHNAWGQVWQEIGNDPENEVIIIAGSGDDWFTSDPGNSTPMHDLPSNELAAVAYDAVKVLENLIFAIDVPTIAAINGPAPAHAEFALACDITLCSDTAKIVDPHFLVGAAPGDGLGLTFQELMGTKRAAYYLYTSDVIDAQAALELGLVNEVLPADQLLPRAWGIAEKIMRRPRNGRRMTHAIITRPWKRRLVNDFGFHLTHELFGLLADKPATKPGEWLKPLDGDFADNAAWQATLAARKNQS
jgi:enoyl-CoA hydratase/carnithine racemase